jgi:hypothetical protein
MKFYDHSFFTKNETIPKLHKFLAAIIMEGPVSNPFIPATIYSLTASILKISLQKISLILLRIKALQKLELIINALVFKSLTPVKYDILSISNRIKGKQPNDGLQTIFNHGKHLYIPGFSSYFRSLNCEFTSEENF